MEITQFISKGNAQIIVGNPEEAMTFYSMALSLDKNCFDAWLGMGLALNTMYRYGEALSCCERALSLTGTLSKPSVWLNTCVTKL